MTPSIVIRGGTVFDGVAPEGVRADIRLHDGMVVEMGSDLPVDGSREIDAGGLWVTPGFIDAHSHGDLSVLTGKEMELRARAGVTTEIVGQDGLGYSGAPMQAADIMIELLAPITGEATPEWWATVADYLSEVDAGAFARVATLAPHGVLRAGVVGRAQRPTTEDEQAQMAALLDAALDDGAAGLSSGLSYPPAVWSDTEELVALLRHVEPRRCRYVTHVRNYGNGFDDAIDEAFTIGRRAHQPVHLSHFHVSGPGRAGMANQYLERCAAAAAAGVEITWDSYPYTAACTFLATVLPSALQGLEAEAVRQALADPAQAAAAVAELDERGPGATVAVGWDRVLLAGLADTELRDWDGRAVGDIAPAESTTPGGVVVEVVRRLPGGGCILVPQGHLDNIRAIAQAPGHVVGSDGILGSGVPHPRASGTFLRFLRWARDGVIDVPVAEVVARMTRRTARLFDLPVGAVRPDAPADVLVLDPDALEDGPDVGRYTPDAVRWSFLGGEPVIDDGRWLGTRPPGMALRRRTT